jgi:hypothetical protein
MAGTAGAVHHHQNKRWAKKEAEERAQYEQEQYEQQQYEQEQYEQQYEQPPAAQEDDVVSQLERLGALKAQGILTEEEFAAQKAKLLGM